MKRSKFVFSFIAIYVSIFFLAQLLCAESHASQNKTDFPYSSGATIRLIVPYSPGGGYDVESRLTAPYIQKHLEEMGGVKITLIVENITGAGGAIATTQVFKEKTDGSILFMLDPESSLWQQDLQAAKFDIRKFVYLGQRSADPITFIVGKEHVNAKSFDEVRQKSLKKSLVLATCGFGGHDHMYPLLFQAFLEEKGLKINFDYLHTEGTGQIVSHFRRAEIDGTMEIIRPFIELINQKEARVLFTFTEQRTTLIPDIPTVYEVPEFAALNKKDVDSLVSIANYRRVLVAPPGTESKKVAVLEEAVKRALSDPELIKKSEEAKRPISFIDATKIQELIKTEWTVADKYLPVIKKIMK